ncbi:MAG: MFS transporter [Acidimicrobiia bacterium]|nr:MFS transporter [Acidimicrobiia bacterium]
MAGRDSLFTSEYRRVSIAILLMVALSAFESLAAIAALPEIAADLGSVTLLPWIVTVYLVAATIASVAAGPFVDSLGVRSIFRIGVAVFGVATVLAAVAPSMEILVLTRAVHGAGGGLVFTSGLAAVPLVYRPGMVGPAYAAGATVWGVNAVAGPAIAAVVLTFAGWRWIFLVILPLVIVGAYLGLTTLPGPLDGAERHPFDWVGLAIVGSFFISFVLALDALDLRSIGFGAVAAGAAALYWRHAKRSQAPVVRVEHFLVNPYRSLWLSIAFLLTGGIGAYVFSPIYVRAARFGSQALTAWTVLFVTVGWTVGANVSGRLQERDAPEVLMMIGSAISAVAMLVTAGFVAAELPLWLIFVSLTFVGSGLGVSTNAALQVVRLTTENRVIGRVTAAHDFGRNIGFSGGTAIGGGILFAVMAGRIADIELVRDVLGGVDVAASDEVASAVAAGIQTMLIVGSVFATVGLVFAWSLRRWRRQQSQVLSEP